MRKEVKHFAELMEQRLKLSDYRGGWEGGSPDYLLSHARKGIDELGEAIYNLDLNGAIQEAVDVGNFLMMIVDIMGDMIKGEGR